MTDRLERTDDDSVLVHGTERGGFRAMGFFILGFMAGIAVCIFLGRSSPPLADDVAPASCPPTSGPLPTYTALPTYTVPRPFTRPFTRTRTNPPIGRRTPPPRMKPGVIPGEPAQAVETRVSKWLERTCRSAQLEWGKRQLGGLRRGEGIACEVSKVDGKGPNVKVSYSRSVRSTKNDLKPSVQRREAVLDCSGSSCRCLSGDCK